MNGDGDLNGDAGSSMKSCMCLRNSCPLFLFVLLIDDNCKHV